RQTRCARVALADGVGGDQAEDPAPAKQVESVAEEMRDQIGIAMRPFMQPLQPWQITLGVAGDNHVLASEGWIADDGVEARIVPGEDLREFDLPVEWRDRVRALAQLLRQSLQLAPHLSCRAVGRAFDLLAPALAGGGLLCGEESRDDRIGQKADMIEAVLDP